MSEIIFQGFNSEDNMLVLNSGIRRVLGSQKIWCEVDNKKRSIHFIIYESEVPAEYQAKTIKMVMDEFINDSRETMLIRAYHDRPVLQELIYAIKSNQRLEW